MIIVRFEGGLGNIMFQYALGRHLALKNSTSMSFDIDTCLVNPLGNYSLSLEAFNIDIQNRIAPPRTIAYYKLYRQRHGRRWWLYNLLAADHSRYFQEHGRYFNSEVLELKDNSYIHGWWQNEKYFKPIRDTLLLDFTLRNPPRDDNKKWARFISTTNAVSIHIRRLDYVTNPRTRAYHGELTQSYYNQALSVIRARVPNPTLFVFSDDIEWVKESMQFPCTTHFIAGNLEVPHEDMHLMSLCKHHIIANSAFSWWGAWLSVSPRKMVIAPRRWTQNPEDPNERVPDDWIKI